MEGKSFWKLMRIPVMTVVSLFRRGHIKRSTRVLSQRRGRRQLLLDFPGTHTIAEYWGGVLYDVHAATQTEKLQV
jgi:hypothetical protein